MRPIFNVRKVIDEIPIIDVMPVVKCKYCEHCFPLVKGGICKISETEVTEEDFCDWWDRQRRRENEVN